MSKYFQLTVCNVCKVCAVTVLIAFLLSGLRKQRYIKRKAWKMKWLFGILFTILNTNYYILIGFICVFVVYSNSLSSIYYVSFDIDIFIFTVNKNK